MKSKIYNSAILNSWLNFAVKLSMNIIAIPFVLSNLSQEEISVWFLLTTVVVMAQSVVFGFNTTFVRFLSYSFSGIKIQDFSLIKNKFIAGDDNKVDLNEFSSLYAVLKRVFMFIGIIFFVIVVTAGTFALAGPINLMNNPNEGWTAFFIIVITSALSLMYNYYQIYLEGINKIALVQRTMAKVNAIGLLLIVVVLSIHTTLITIVLIYQSILMMNLFFLIKLARNTNDGFLLKLPKQPFKKEVFFVVLDTAWKSGVTTVIASIVKNISGVLVANILGASQASSFLLTKRVFEIIDSFTMTVFQAMTPKIASLRGSGKMEILMPMVKKLFYLSYAVFIFSYLFFLIFGEYFLELIDSNTSIGSVGLVIAFSYASLISRWGGMVGILTNQSNLILEHISVIFYSLGFFLFVYLFYEQLDSLVFPIGTVVGVILASLVTSKRAYRTFNTTFFLFEKKLLIPVMIILTLINIVYYRIYA